MEEGLKTVERDIQRYKHLLRTASVRMITEGISGFPIFVAHQGAVSLGLPLIDHKATGSNWSINVSMIEEFLNKEIILVDRLEDFKRSYKDPNKTGCLFVITENGANFVFFPY